jgi:hypothetical protein
MSKTSESSEPRLSAQSVILEGHSGGVLLAEARSMAALHIPDTSGRIASGEHPEVTEFDGAATKDQLERLRDMLADVFTRPFTAEKKVYIIKDADRLNAGSRNKLLKILEEPPPYAYIYLLCENAENLNPTIRSRCVLHKLPRAVSPSSPDLERSCQLLLAALSRPGPHAPDDAPVKKELAACSVILSWEKMNRDDFCLLLEHLRSALHAELTVKPIARLPQSAVFTLLDTIGEILSLRERNPLVVTMCAALAQACAEVTLTGKEHLP